MPGAGIFLTHFQLFKGKNKTLFQADSPGKWRVLEGQWTKVKKSWETILVSAECDMASDSQFPSGKGVGNSEGQRSLEATRGSSVLPPQSTSELISN